MEPDEQRSLGRGNVRVTRLGLGAAPLAGLYQAVDELQAATVVETALAQGIRYVDTAPLYGHGLSERRVGAVLSGRPRDSFVLSTKVGRLLRIPKDGGGETDAIFEGAPPEQPIFDFSRDGVLRSIEESLERLCLDRVDIVYIHDPDDRFEDAMDGAYPALHDLRAQGAVGAIGVGMNSAESLVRFAMAGDFDCFLLAGRYTLLEQGALDTVLPVCLEKGISIVVGGVYNSGVLAEPGPAARYNYAPAPPHIVDRTKRLLAVCASHEVPLKAAAIQFPFGHPAVASVLVGCRSTDELEENIRMLRFPISSALWDDLRGEGLVSPAAPLPSSA